MPAPRVTEVRAGSIIDGSGWTITVGHAEHVQPYLECVAFRLDSDDGSVCYSGDSSPCDALVELARGCDILIQMNHYFSGMEPSAAYRAACGHHRGNAELARQAGVETLVLTHVPPDLDAPDTRERVLAEIRQIFEGRVVWGEDLMEWTL
jgi:ribonuclease BN (tRNA processing enzyme)